MALACVGLRQCTSSFSCCNYYDRSGICTSSCRDPTVLLPDNTCGCMPGLTGTSCDVIINFCDSDPCMNSGTCSSSRNGFNCSCPPEYTGVSCEVGTQCMQHQDCNNAQCVQGNCVCDPGFADPPNCVGKCIGNDCSVLYSPTV